MKKNIVACILLIYSTFFCNAQKIVLHDNQQWFQYYNQLKLSEKLTLYSDIGVRRIDNFNEWSQMLLRMGLGYSIAQNLQGITGIGCFTSYANSKLIKIEYRP